MENVEHVYGAKDENGSWVGLVGMLHRKVRGTRLDGIHIPK